jgi:hypothetical protein
VQLVTLDPDRETPRLHIHTNTYFNHIHAITGRKRGYPYIVRCNAQSDNRQMFIFLFIH